MKITITLLAIIMGVSIYGQEYVSGQIITQRYDTISDVMIKKMSPAKSFNQLIYTDSRGAEHQLQMENVKCYTRGKEVFCRIFHSGEMIMVKKIVSGTKLNLYVKYYNGRDIYFVEKVYDELIKVPTAHGKFRKVMSEFLQVNEEIARKIKSNELDDINEIVELYNAS
jgi:hypothetical protein